MVDGSIGDQLSFLLGSAAGPERVHASAWGPALIAQASTSGRTELDGALVVMTLTESRPDGTTFRVVNVFVLDPADGAVLLYAFDSLGFPPEPPARGTWEGAELTLARSTHRGSSRTSYRSTPTGFTWSKKFRGVGDSSWHAVVDAEMTSSR